MILRGEVWWTALPSPIGRRPAVVIQSNDFNDSRLSTVVVILLTTNLVRADDLGNVRIPRSAGGLAEASVANVTQLYTVHKSNLAQRIGMVPPTLMQRIDNGIKFVLALR